MLLSRTAYLRLLLGFVISAGVNDALAADAITRLTIFPTFTATVPATPDPGITNGRACIFGDGAALAEDPTGACLGTFRNITPPLPPASVSTFLASATASVALLGGGNKSLTAHAFDIGPDYAEAEAKDPITVGPVSVPGQLSVSLILEQLSIQSDQIGSATINDTFGSNLVSTQPLFSLNVTGKDGMSPTVTLELSSFLVGMGWNQTLLTSELNAALLSGSNGSGGFSVTGFALPNITFDVPAGVQAELVGDADAQAGVPEPSTIVLVGIGVALCAFRVVRRGEGQNVSNAKKSD
jgi:hypothetical protein